MDPGVTAELEYLLDDVLTGRQEMTGAIDAVCDTARRIIGRLRERGADEEAVVPGDAPSGGDDRRPTSKMRKFAASIAKSKGIGPPAGYTKSATLCRAFLDEHAPRRNPERATDPDGGTAASWSSGGMPPRAGRTRRGTEKPKSAGASWEPSSERALSRPPASSAGAAMESSTPLRIPYGNKEVAFSLGARYGPDGWFAPPGVDLDAFRRRGWL